MPDTFHRSPGLVPLPWLWLPSVQPGEQRLDFPRKLLARYLDRLEQAKASHIFAAGFFFLSFFFVAAYALSEPMTAGSMTAAAKAAIMAEIISFFTGRLRLSSTAQRSTSCGSQRNPRDY